jgi:hypothetical protein
LLFDAQFSSLSFSEAFVEKLKQGISDPEWAKEEYMVQLWQEVTGGDSNEKSKDKADAPNEGVDEKQNMTDLLLLLLTSGGNSKAVISFLQPAIVKDKSVGCTQPHAAQLAKLGFDVRQECGDSDDTSKMWNDYGKATLANVGESAGKFLEESSCGRLALLLLPCCRLQFVFAFLRQKFFPSNDQLTARPVVRCNFPSWTSPKVLLALHEHARLDVFEQEPVTALIRWKWQQYGWYVHIFQMALYISFLACYSCWLYALHNNNSDNDGLSSKMKEYAGPTMALTLILVLLEMAQVVGSGLLKDPIQLFFKVPILSVLALLISWYQNPHIAHSNDLADEDQTRVTPFLVWYILTTLLLYVRLLFYLRAFR